MNIFIINISEIDNIPNALLDSFKHKDFLNTKKQKEHCFTYLMLDRILKEVYKIKNRDIVFINNKPFLKNREMFISLSHSENYIAVGLSDSNCGLDIEKIKNRNFQLIAKRMKFKSKTLKDFYYDWTKYEAEYKLGKKAEAEKRFVLENYILTAVSENPQETFDIYIQK